MSVPKLPLSGITVVSLEQAVAAPYATRQLADLGARVIKVERPGGGDFARRYDTTVHGHSSYFVWLNRSKESLTLDLKDPRGLEILHRLLDDADVFVQNLAPEQSTASASTRTRSPSVGRGSSRARSPDTAPTDHGPTASRTTCWCSARPAWSP